MTRAEKGEIMHQKEIDVPKEYLRFATPANVALYRAERLKCDVIVDIGCGIGGQTMAFAETCKKVIAVEKDKKVIEIAETNLRKLGYENVHFIHGDALANDIIEIIKKEKPDIIFCDTERGESGKRSVNDLKPNISELIKEYSQITKEIAIEMPPFVQDLDKLKEEYEREFLSSNGELNRLTLYFNGLKSAGKCVVALPSKARLDAGTPKEVVIAKAIEDFSYLYTIDPAVVLAGLVNELAEKLGLEAIEIDGKLYFVSKELKSSSFIKNYKILAVCKNDFDDILDNLKKVNANKVVLRYNIDPAEYWIVRKRYEEMLEGNKEKVHLFISYKKAIICQSLDY